MKHLAFAALVVLVSGFSTNALADECENLENETVVTGEARYWTKSGADENYGNQYADAGDEIKLKWRQLVGAKLATKPFKLRQNAFIEDDATDDCSDIKFWYLMCNADTSTGVGVGPCDNTDGSCCVLTSDSSYQCMGWVSWRVNGCNAGGCVGNNCKFHGFKTFGYDTSLGDVFFTYADIERITPSAAFMSADSGCILVDSGLSCDLNDF
jgi:hypothetical protein